MSAVPKLRFPGFNEEWKQVAVEEILQVTRGKVLAMPLVDPVQSPEKPFPVYSSQTKMNGLAGFFNEYLFENAITWTTDGANAGEVRLRAEKFYCTNVCGVLLSDKGYVNNFIASALNNVAKKYVSYVGNPKLMNGVMAKIPITIPSLPEQQKIASFLSSVDKKIDLLRQKKDALELYKKGLMQKIFSQEIRFKADDGSDFPDWEDANISSIGEIMGGGTPDTGEDRFWNGGINWFTPTEIKDKYLVESSRKITPEGVQKSSAKILPIGSVLFTSRASIGDVGILLQDATTNQGFQSIVVNRENNNEFVYYWLIFNRDEFIRRSSGSTFLEISKTEILKTKMNRPCKDEQQKIASFLSAIDLKIQKTTSQIEGMETFKKGLLQQMFV